MCHKQTCDSGNSNKQNLATPKNLVAHAQTISQKKNTSKKKNESHRLQTSKRSVHVRGHIGNALLSPQTRNLNELATKNRNLNKKSSQNYTHNLQLPDTRFGLFSFLLFSAQLRHYGFLSCFPMLYMQAVHLLT